jgi:hypothetical protein
MHQRDPSRNWKGAVSCVEAMPSPSRALPLHAVIAFALVAAIGCRSSAPPQEVDRTVTVYVSTDRVFSEPILREHEKRSGVKVNAVYDTEETKSTGLAVCWRRRRGLRPMSSGRTSLFARSC